MTVEPIGIAVLLIGLVSLYFKSTFIVYVFVASTLLGSAGAVILDSLGGTNIQPAHVLLGFLAIKLLSDRTVVDNASEGLGFGQPTFWLSMAALYAIISAWIMPLLFAGSTYVFPVRATLQYRVPLEPSTSNLTQSVYFIGNLICFGLLRGYASTAAGKRRLANAMLSCAVLNLVFVAIDLITYWTGTSEALSFMRNASYALLSDTEEFGFKRIVGSFTEASSFSYATIGLFGFTSALWLRGAGRPVTPIVTLLSFAALLFSTSTTAYVGLAAILIIQFLDTLIRSAFRLSTLRIIYIILVPFILCVLALVVALNDAWSSYVTGMIDTMVFNKMSSSSGIERSSWNSQAIQNFFDTFGLGAGNGSLRASSFPISVIASLGVVGTFPYAMFILQVWTWRSGSRVPSHDETVVQDAARFACLGWLIAASISGTLIDLGLPFFISAALASAGTKQKLASPMSRPAMMSDAPV